MSNQANLELTDKQNLIYEQCDFTANTIAGCVFWQLVYK